MNKPCLLILFLFVLAFNSTSLNHETATPQILALSSKQDMPQANINDVAWLAGHWRGEMFGGTAEEIWSLPYENSMMGMYKHVINGKVTFYELMIIIEESGSLVLKLKHFDRDLTAWEEKKETVDFPLVKITATEIYFDGLTFRNIDANTTQCWLRTKKAGKSLEVIGWLYHRVSEPKK